MRPSATELFTRGALVAEEARIPLRLFVETESFATRSGREDFLEAFAEFLMQKYRASVRVDDWPSETLPAHLKSRVEVVDARNKIVTAGRDLASIQTQMESENVRSVAWEKACRHWEQRAVSMWSFGDLPETVVVEEVGGVAVLAFPGLALRDAEVDVRLFRKREEAESASELGVRRLAELALERDLGRRIRACVRSSGAASFCNKPQSSSAQTRR